MNYIFAGDRQISCEILNFIINKGFRPKALLVSKGANASHVNELIKISGLTSDFIIEGMEFKSDESIKILENLNVDYIFGIHFPYIIPKEILAIPKVGFINLHPAYLPYNKGWHTPSWAILDNTPYGATLHFMSEELDKGDIIFQKKIIIKLNDTADSLYQRVLNLEYEVFTEAFEDLISLKPNRLKQTEIGTEHFKKDLSTIQEINIKDLTEISVFLNKLRALTTNNPNELSYFMDNNKKIGVKIEFIDISDL